MSFYQVVAFPPPKGCEALYKPFVDRQLYTEICRVEERLQELTALYPQHTVEIIVVSIEDRKRRK